jgi:hypothetical protein
MANHINIQDPDNQGLDSSTYRNRLEIDKLQLELKQLQIWYRSLEEQLSSIFTRIRRGETCELHYRDGTVYVISGVERE